MKKLFSLSLLAGLTGALISFASPAQACRDCPFPMKIGQHQWLLPQDNLVLTIDEEQISATQIVMMITLQNRQNGRMVAMGQVYRLRTQRSVSVQLKDRNGRRMKGTLSWSDEGHNNLQAEFIAFDEYSDAAPSFSALRY